MIDGSITEDLVERGIFRHPSKKFWVWCLSFFGFGLFLALALYLRSTEVAVSIVVAMSVTSSIGLCGIAAVDAIVRVAHVRKDVEIFRASRPPTPSEGMR